MYIEDAGRMIVPLYYRHQMRQMDEKMVKFDFYMRNTNHGQEMNCI